MGGSRLKARAHSSKRPGLPPSGLRPQARCHSCAVAGTMSRRLMMLFLVICLNVQAAETGQIGGAAYGTVAACWQFYGQQFRKSVVQLGLAWFIGCACCDAFIGSMVEAALRSS